MIDVSIIIPTYNIENYIAECVNCIAKQTKCTFEVIIIDDCSTDQTPFICENLKESYPFIKLIKLKENRGVSYCRNIGLENSAAEYVCFLDGDDYYCIDFLHYFYKHCKEYNLDLVRGNYSIKKGNSIHIRQNVDPLKKIDKKIFNGHDFLNYTVYNDVNEVVPWLGFYSSYFLKNNKISFPLNISYEEDHVFYLNCLLKAQKVMYLDKTFYMYRYRTGSASKTFSVEKALDVLKVVKKEFDLLSPGKKPEAHVLKYIGSSFYQLTSIFGRVGKNEQKMLYKAFKSYDFNKRYLYNATTKKQCIKNFMFINFHHILSFLYRILKK